MQAVQHSIEEAAKRIQEVAKETPLEFNQTASKKYGANVYFKREDLQVVRSYKIRGAYNKIVQLSTKEQQAGVVCASAGNHAQGVALSCAKLHVHGTIYMPTTTPKQKIDQVKMFGEQWIDIILKGDTFDESNAAALEFSGDNGHTFIPPFDDEKIIEGQATVGLEMINQADFAIDYVVLPVGGGGLASGVSTIFKERSPNTRIIAAEPAGAPSLQQSMEYGHVITLPKIKRFVDGAAVKRIGDLTFEICKENVDRVITVEEGEICSNILELYNRDAIVVEPAGALSLAALRQMGDEIKGKNVVCVLSGSNNDITRMEEIKEMALLFEGLKHYFIIEFPQRSGALRDFVNRALGEGVDITYFQYHKRINRESGPVVIGLEIPEKDEFPKLIKRFDELDFEYQYLNDNQFLFSTLIG